METVRGGAFRGMDDEALARAKAGIGYERECRQFNEEASKDTIRHFAEGVGDDNPLWIDEEYAKKTSYGCIIAPPTFPCTCSSGALWRIEREEGGRSIHQMRGFYGGEEWEFYKPVRVGDRLKATYKLVDFFEKPSKQGLDYVVSVEEIKCVNQNGDIPAKYSRSWIAFKKPEVRGEQTRQYAKMGKWRYTTEELEAIERDYDKEERRGEVPRFWEDVNVGDDLGHVVKGPLTSTDDVAWIVAWGGPFVMANRIAHMYAQRHPGALFVDPETNVPDFAERQHWEDRIAQDSGFPAAFDFGPQRIAWLAHLVTNWMGDDGFIERLSVRVSRLNFIGDTQWCRGKVVDKYISEGRHLVKADIWADNQRKERTAYGFAVVCLPSKEKG